MDSLNEIDSLFKEGEHQKELAISQDLKNRMNQELGASKNSNLKIYRYCLLYTSPSPRDQRGSRMPSSA